MGLLVVGSDTSFARAPGGVRWLRDAWGMDRLIVSMQGPAEDLDDYVDSLDEQMWSASDIDENMFLSDWDNDDHPVWPTVKLIYIGKKGGVLPPFDHGSNSPTQTAQIPTSPPTTMVYKTKQSRVTWISREEGVGGDTATPPPNYYIIPGTVAPGSALPTNSWLCGSTAGMAVGDYVAIFIHATNTNGSVVGSFWPSTVDTIVDGTGFTTADSYPGISGSGWTYYWDTPNTSYGTHIADIEVKSLKGCGWGPDVSGEDVSNWGAVLIGVYFIPILSVTLETDELVPGEYWRNTQTIGVQLLPQPC